MKKIIILIGILYSVSSFAQIEITLRKTFIDSIKHRISISADFFVTDAHDRPNSGAKDGDLHIAGYDTKIGLPAVAEMMNAKGQTTSVNIIQANRGGDNPVQMTGVWRFWCEHPGAEASFKQGNQSALDNITGTNPDHAFEIHPVLTVGNRNLINSLKPIPGFKYKDATQAFNAYSNVRCKLKDKGDKIMIQTNGIGYNYVDFRIEIIDTNQFVVEDGRFVMCRVLDKDGEVIVNKMRMAFPLNSAAEKKIRTKHKGDILHVAGIPRICMALVVYRIEHKDDFEDILEWNLPVEMVIVSLMQ